MRTDGKYTLHTSDNILEWIAEKRQILLDHPRKPAMMQHGMIQCLKEFEEAINTAVDENYVD